MKTQLKALTIGLIAGLGGGLFSLGGGTLTVPLLLRWLGLSVFEARGTALAAAFLPAVAGMVLYAQAGKVDWLAVVMVSVPAMMVTPLTGMWTERLSGTHLRRVFGAVVVTGAVFLLLRDQLLGSWAIPEIGRPWYMIGVGIIEGLVAGSVGISGGPVLAPLLVLGLGMPQQLAQGCSLAARIPVVISGSVENMCHRHVCLRLLPALFAGGLVGIWLGSRTALALSELHLRSLFAIILLVLGIRYLREKIRT